MALQRKIQKEKELFPNRFFIDGTSARPVVPSFFRSYYRMA